MCMLLMHNVNQGINAKYSKSYIVNSKYVSVYVASSMFT